MATDFSALQMQDCMTIQKAFERSASYAVTEESVFAMMAPILTGMRTQTAGLVNQLEAGDARVDIASFKNQDKATEDDEGYFSKLKSNWVPGGTSDPLGGLFDSKCIPCGFRLDTAGAVALGKFSEFGSAFLDHWKQWLGMFMKQLMQLKDLFSLPDQYVDICALIKFFLDFMCVPDLQRMLSVFMALMARVSFDFGGVIDLILGLVAPLLTPFLSAIIDMLAEYIMMIVRPIECIIDAIQDMIAKMDYNILFQNIEQLDKNISVGRKQGGKVGTGGSSMTASMQQMRNNVPGVASVIPPDADVELTDLHSGPDRYIEYDFNMLGPAADSIKRHNAEKQAAVEKAYEELQALQGRGPTGTTPGETERYRQQLQASKDKYRDAKEQRDLSALGRMNAKIDRAMASFKSIMFTVIDKLKKAAAAVEGFFHSVVDELQKIMGEFIGGSGSFIELMFEKMELVQLISLIGSIIAFMMRGLKCDDDEDDRIKVEKFVSTHQGMAIWTDDAGNVHIEEDDDEILQAVTEAVKALGTVPMFESSTAAVLGGTSMDPATQATLEDKGALPADPRQKLKSLIEFTGDPVLDTEIARATEAMITPVKVTFKCPLQTTVAQTDQINTWIEELDSI